MVTEMVTEMFTEVATDSPLISLAHCSVVLGDHDALTDISFELRRGERWALVGDNGAGKSVLLKLLRGDMWPTPTGHEQRRYCFDNEVSTAPVGIKQHIALLTPERQDKYVRYDWDLSVDQVVTTGLFDEDIPLTTPTAAQQRQVTRMLKRCKLWSLRARHFLSLSYGQRRRVLLARVLVASPPVLLLDEVFNGLDAANRGFLKRVLENTHTTHTWMIAAHSADDIPANATHLARLQAGRLIATGPIKSAQHRELRVHNPARGKIVKPKPRVSSKQHRVDAGQPLIKLEHVELYRDYRLVLRSFSWTVQRGEHWAIMGANGSGKSSLLMLLYGDLHPALGGSIERAGHQRGMPISNWKQRVALVSPELQADHFHAGTLEEIVASGRYASIGLNESLTTADRRKARRWLTFFDLYHLRARGVREVSYGQLRLALLARAMVNQPQLLLLDEPFTGLDPEWRAYAYQMLERVAVAGTQVIMAVHQMNDMIPAITKVLRIERGGSVRVEV